MKWYALFSGYGRFSRLSSLEVLLPWKERRCMQTNFTSVSVINPFNCQYILLKTKQAAHHGTQTNSYAPSDVFSRDLASVCCYETGLEQSWSSSAFKNKIHFSVTMFGRCVAWKNKSAKYLIQWLWSDKGMLQLRSPCDTDTGNDRPVVFLILVCMYMLYRHWINYKLLGVIMQYHKKGRKIKVWHAHIPHHLVMLLWDSLGLLSEVDNISNN